VLVSVCVCVCVLVTWTRSIKGPAISSISARFTLLCTSVSFMMYSTSNLDSLLAERTYVREGKGETDRQREGKGETDRQSEREKHGGLGTRTSL